MTLQSSGILYMSQINGEFGRGNDLNAYRGTYFYYTDGNIGYFPSGQIAFSDFYSKSLVQPLPADVNTANAVVGGTTTVWIAGSQYLGIPHPRRVVVVACATGDTTGSPISSVQIGGVTANVGARTNASGSMRAVAVYWLSVPTGSYADIRVANSGSANSCLISTYAVYPQTAARAAFDNATTTASSCTTSSLTWPNVGIVIGASHHRNTNGTTWEAGSAGLGWSVSYNGTVGGVNCSTAMATTYGNVGAVRISYAGSNNGGLAVCSFGPR